jgi:hypothetical protein
MEDKTERAKARMHAWVQAHRQVVLYDEESSSLMDVASGKSIRVPWQDVETLEEKIHPETKDTYLVMLFENGNQIALVEPGGIAFAPLTVNTGSLRDLPPVVCLRDFHTLKQRIDHHLYGHQDEPPPKECLDLVMICIATLDGARAVGFDVDDLERELEGSLNELERRKS